MKVSVFKSKLAGAVPSGCSFLFGYAEEVNQLPQNDFPKIRVYPFKWRIPRGDSFTIPRQSVFIYTEGSDKEAAWDAAIELYQAWVAAIPEGVEIKSEPVDVTLYDYGAVIENVRVVEIVVPVKVWC